MQHETRSLHRRVGLPAVVFVFVALFSVDALEHSISAVTGDNGPSRASPPSFPNGQQRESIEVAPQQAPDSGQDQTAIEISPDTGRADSTPNEAATWEAAKQRVLAQNAQIVQDQYSLLLEYLGLSPQQNEAVLEVLADSFLANARVIYYVEG